jgi:hypothetical protein
VPAGALSASHRARRTRPEAAVAALHKQSAIAVSLFSRRVEPTPFPSLANGISFGATGMSVA